LNGPSVSQSSARSCTPCDQHPDIEIDTGGKESSTHLDEATVGSGGLSSAQHGARALGQLADHVDLQDALW
jgi:hypothetical protein